VFPLDAAAGKRVHYSGYIRTEGVTQGYAGLWWRVDGEKGILAFNNMQDLAPRGTTDWTRYEISLVVPAGARNIAFGVLHPGDGTAWFDGLQVDLDGTPYTNPQRFDFDFESPALRGFVAGGAGYEISLDKAVARQGPQSLREFTVPPAPADSLDAALAATGLPVLAVDLRQAPATGPVAERLSAAHKTRSIGSMFSEIMASAYLMHLKAPEAYDALLFVEKTTSARRNPPIATAR
jgi:hypothetical protein